MNLPQKKIYGLIGYPVKHSLSPLMHNAAFQTPEIKNKIEAEYRLFEIEPAKLETFLLDDVEVPDIQGEKFYSQDIIGFNITIPHKVRAKEILESKFPPSDLEKILNYVKLSGAVNTVKRKIDGTLEYTNTDYSGFSKSLKEDLKFDPKDKNILLIGCGGAGRAVVAALVWKVSHPQRIYIYEPNSEAATSAEEHFKDFTILREKRKFILKEQVPEIIKKCQLLVNASPVGMKEGDGSVIEKNLLHKGLFIFDLVYNRKTQLIKNAESLELPARDGLGMLLYQGVATLEYWLRPEIQKIPDEVIEIMRQALNKGVNKL